MVQPAPRQVNLADLNNDEDQASKKIRLCIEEAAWAHDKPSPPWRYSISSRYHLVDKELERFD